MGTLEYALNRNPVIVALTNEKDLDKALQSNSNIIILIQSDICTLKEVTKKIKDAGKIVLIHMDLVKGLKRDSASIKYLAEFVGIDGIVTTHANLIRTAKEFNLLTIQRVFILDTASISQALRLTSSAKPDAIEVLPGIATSYLSKKISNEDSRPIIAAGLIHTKEEIEKILNDGATGISSSSHKVWAYK